MSMARRTTATQTAFGPTMFAAAERYLPAAQRVTDDDLAFRFLPPGLRLMTGLLRWRVLRDLMARATERQAPGLWGGMVARKRYADDQVAEALEAGIAQVVFLGAGLDTRAFRLVVPSGAEAFELDLPANIAYIRRQAERVFGTPPARVMFVPIDFETDDLGHALTSNGFAFGRPAMFVWEAVSQYLTEAGVRRTLAALSEAAAGSRLIFTYVRRDFLEGKNLYGWQKAYEDWVVNDRLWRFGLEPDEVGPLLGEYGWSEREQVGADEYRTRYFEPAGRELTAIELERFVSAEKL
jgi:methyltransferase (TIGR00027 family)